MRSDAPSTAANSVSATPVRRVMRVIARPPVERSGRSPLGASITAAACTGARPRWERSHSVSHGDARPRLTLITGGDDRHDANRYPGPGRPRRRQPDGVTPVAADLTIGHSSRSPSAGVSSTRPGRSAAYALRLGHSPLGVEARRTSGASGGGRRSRCRTTWSGSTRRSSCRETYAGYSGHVDAFVDPLTGCQSAHRRFQADQLEEAYEAKHGHLPENELADVNCPNCEVKGSFTEPKMFNGLMKTFLGPVPGVGGPALLRPRQHRASSPTSLSVMNSLTAQATVRHRPGRQGVPQQFTPGTSSSRTREFEQMKAGVLRPSRAPTRNGTSTGCGALETWYVDLGIDPQNLRYAEHRRTSCRTVQAGRSTSSTATASAVRSSPSWGIANRTDFDLSTAREARRGRSRPTSTRTRASGGRRMSSSRRGGLTRSLLAFLLDMYDVDGAPAPKVASTHGQSCGSTRDSHRSRRRFCRSPQPRPLAEGT